MLHKNYIKELSKIYCRLMDLEHSIKIKLQHCLENRYHDDSYQKTIGFFLELDFKTNRKKATFRNISQNNNINEKEKLKESINALYLSETFDLLKYKNHRKNLLKAGFLSLKDYNIIKSRFSKLCNLRNSVAHYNYRDYLLNKIIYIDILRFFEHEMNLMINPNLLNLPKFLSKPKTRLIIEEIYNIDPSLLTNDRNLCDLFDEIALYNGYTYNELPKYWTIIRQKYDFEKKIKEPGIIKHI